MNYIEIFKRLKAADSRIKYDVIQNCGLESENCIPDFYKFVNPINVEFEYGEGIVRIASYEELPMLKKNYEYVKSGCVFATCNGEPVYLNNNKVYTCVCGKNRMIEEKLAESLELFFEQAIKNL